MKFLDHALVKFHVGLTDSKPFNFMIVANRLLGTSFALALVLLAALPLKAQVSWDFMEPIDVASSDFGNRCPRLVLDALGNPVVFVGKTNEGMFVVTSDNGSFNEPQLVPTEPGIFLSDAEGPDVAVWGNTIGLAYQIVGQWATGSRFMRSDDGGQTWSASHPIAPNATEDHFMPIPSFDEQGNPFVALKLGAGNNAREAVLRSPDGGSTWTAAEVASFGAGNGIACECCPSRTIFGNGRYHTIYRRNDNNVRDMWLVSSEDGLLWDQQLDLDPTNWLISACPETGASSAWLPDGRLATAFMSAGEGSSRVYLNLSDPAAGNAGSTQLLVPSLQSNAVQNQPDIAVGATHTAVAWQENSSGWQIHLALTANTNLPEGLIDVGFPITLPFDNLSGSNRQPEVAIHGNDLHVIWQNSGDGTVKYLRGSLESVSQIAPHSKSKQDPRLSRRGVGVVALQGAKAHSTYRILSPTGSILHEGLCDALGGAILPAQHSHAQLLLVQAQTNQGSIILKLGLERAN